MLKQGLNSNGRAELEGEILWGPTPKQRTTGN